MEDENINAILEVFERNPGASVLDLLAFEVVENIMEEEENGINTSLVNVHTKWINSTKTLLKALKRLAKDKGYDIESIDEALDNLP